MQSSSSSIPPILQPSNDQKQTLAIIAIYVVAILILWNVPFLKTLLYPFKILTVALHEFGHASAGLLTGAKIISVEVNPNQGGVTVMAGGIGWVTLPAGYIGSSFWGAMLVCAGFNVFASKVASGVLALMMAMTLWWSSNWFTRLMTVLVIGMIVALWLYENGVGLRFFVLFMGVMSCFYSLWDVVEDLVVRKINGSDATAFAKQFCYGCIPAQLWGLIWFLVSLVFLAGGVLLGVVLFKGSPESIPYVSVGGV